MAKQKVSQKALGFSIFFPHIARGHGSIWPQRTCNAPGCFKKEDSFPDNHYQDRITAAANWLKEANQQ